jgi:hypothetical protein
MDARRIIPHTILITLIFLALGGPRRDVAFGQAPGETAVAGPYMFEPPAVDCSTPKPVLIEPQPQVWVQPAAPVEVVPVLPLPQSAGPRPEGMLGPMFGAPVPGVAPEALPAPAEAGSPLENIAPGGAVSPQFGLPSGPEAAPGCANPIFVPAVNDEYAWEQIADVVSDYFTISREQQVRRSGDAWCEGRIETQYQGGATWLEPFRKDSVGMFNRWESTFQTIRRKATVRVMPDANGYLVEVVVEKELEDLPHPERSSAGAAAFPNDSSLPSERSNNVSRTLSSPRWLPLGRDPALEARMLAEIHARLNGVTTVSSPSIFP